MTGVFGEKYHHRNLCQEVLMTPNIHTIIRQHISLEVRCIDRVYLHGYMPKLQTSGGLCYFLHDYLGHPVPSPALLKPRHDRFVTAVQTFASDRHVPFVSFERVDSKDAFVAPYRARFTAREGVVVIGVAQEKMRSFKAHKRPGRGHTPVFDFSRRAKHPSRSIIAADCGWCSLLCGRVHPTEAEYRRPRPIFGEYRGLHSLEGGGHARGR
jgi:hypothetical protein